MRRLAVGLIVATIVYHVAIYGAPEFVLLGVLGIGYLAAIESLEDEV